MQVGMDQEDFFLLRIPTSRPKLLPNFPKDPKADIEIVFKDKSFTLCKAYLRIDSNYFKDLPSDCKRFEINENFDEKALEEVLSCFYGAAIQMPKTDVGRYYPIIKFLEIECMHAALYDNILSEIEHYDLFVVIRIAHRYSDQKMFEKCFEALEKESFEQLKYHQFELLQCELSLFKLIIKTHNQHRNEGHPGLPYVDIDAIIKDYCETHNMGEDGYRSLKFELIDKNSLSSTEYKEIFLDDMVKVRNKSSSMPEYPTGHSVIINGNSGDLTKLDTTNLTESVIGPGVGLMSSPLVAANKSMSFSNMNAPQYSNIFSHNQTLSLEMELTFQKKKNEQLSKENSLLEAELQNLKMVTLKNQEKHSEMQQELKTLKEQLKSKEKTQVEHKRQIHKFEATISEMQKQLTRKSKAIDDLVVQFEQLKKAKISNEDQESNMIAQSQFLPAHLIKEMMVETNSKTTPQPQKGEKSANSVNYDAMDDEELQQLYLPRIGFDEEPVSTPKKNLPKLCNLITGEGFTKHTLTLIYRRSARKQSVGQNSDIRQKNNLLILINTATGLNIGGFCSVPIPKGNVDYVKDPQAFLFTLTHNKKFPIKKGSEFEAIFMSEQYLISFSNDLMIASECLQQKSECKWPSSYEGAHDPKDRQAGWLAGAGSFGIKDIDIYQMGEQEMEMVL